MLKWKPQLPKPVVAKPRLGEFKIVEEYTLDKQNSSFKKLAVVRPTPVETPLNVEQPSMVTSPSVPVKDDSKVLSSKALPPTSSPDSDKQTGPKVVYAADNTEFYVGTTPAAPKREPASDVISPDSYPWKKKLCVSIHKLSDFEVSYWTGRNNHDSDDLPIKLETSPDETPPSASMLPNTCSHSHLKDEPSADAPNHGPPSDQTTHQIIN